MLIFAEFLVIGLVGSDKSSFSNFYVLSSLQGPTILPSSGVVQLKSCIIQYVYREPYYQIYCPLDSPMSAYHRCLYLFICRKASCVNKGRYVHSFLYWLLFVLMNNLFVTSIKCLRVQCSNSDWPRSAALSVYPKLCVLCG